MYCHFILFVWFGTIEGAWKKVSLTSHFSKNVAMDSLVYLNDFCSRVESVNNASSVVSLVAMNDKNKKKYLLDTTILDLFLDLAWNGMPNNSAVLCLKTEPGRLNLSAFLK